MERLTNPGTKESKSNITIRQVLDKLSQFEDLEELIGIPLEDIAKIFRKNIPEDCKHPRKAIVLTDDDVDRWNCYKNEEEQGLLLRLPCKVGDIVYKIINQRDNYDDTVYQIVSSTIFELSMIDKIGKTVFLTQAEADQKLKEMESEKHERRNTRKLRSARMELY